MLREEKEKQAIARWVQEEGRGTIRRCFLRGCMDSDEGISTKDEVGDHELGMNIKVMVVTTESVQMEELRVGDGEPGMGREEGEFYIGV